MQICGILLEWLPNQWLLYKKFNTITFIVLNTKSSYSGKWHATQKPDVIVWLFLWVEEAMGYNKSVQFLEQITRSCYDSLDEKAFSVVEEPLGMAL